jgi:glucose-1-phosphate thymidylyltransferase
MATHDTARGIVLAGGIATRLYPATKTVSKQLLPVYDKPMIYYPLSVLVQAGVRQIMIITTPDDRPLFERLLGDGSRLGLTLVYREQPRPEGLAQAFVIAADFIQGHSACLILGDNIFYGEGLLEPLKKALSRDSGATIFAYWVNDPERYGVVTFDAQNRPRRIVEKPASPISNWAVTGLYVYDRHVSDMAATLRPSGRGEYEITDLNMLYLRKEALRVEKLGRGMAWLDTGTHESFAQATSFIQIIEQRQGLKIACLEEIAYRLGYISRSDLEAVAKDMEKSSYGLYLQKLIDEQDQ